MATLKRYIQTLGMIMLIAIFYYLPIEGVLPYILPITIVGIVAILLFAFASLKRRGFLVLLLMALCCSGPVYAYEIIDCKGSYDVKKTANMTVQAVQDALVGGNVTSSDFSDKRVLACVIVNVTNLRGEICGADMQSGKCDPALRSKAFYVQDNVLRMSVDEATDNIGGHSWIQKGVASYNDQRLMDAYNAAASAKVDENDAKRVRACAVNYIEYCADLEKQEQKNCRTVAQTMVKDTEECWICDIVSLIITAIQKMAGNTYLMMRKLSLGLLGIMFLFWIAFKVLELIGQMGYGDNGAFFTEFLIRVITVSIAAAILHAPIVDFYRVAISPFIMVSAGLYRELADATVTDGKTSFADEVRQEMKVAQSPKSCFSACDKMNDPNFKFDESTEGEVAVLDPSSINAFQCMTCTAYNQVTPFIAIGEAMNCYAIVNGFSIPLTPYFFPKLHYMVVGYTLVIVFSFIALLVGLYIIDIILRLGFVIVLTPLLITAWAFPISREYATRGWNLILYCLLQFIGLAIVLALFGAVVTEIIPGSTTQLISNMSKNNIPNLYDIFMTMGGLYLFLIVGSVLFAFKLMTSTDEIISALSGISPGIPGVSFGALAGMAKEGLALAGVGAGVSKKVGGQVSKKVGSKLSKAANNRRFESKSGGDSEGSGGGEGPRGGNGSGGDKSDGNPPKPTRGQRMGEAGRQKISNAGDKVGGAVESSASKVGDKISNAGESVRKAGAEKAQQMSQKGKQAMAAGGPVGWIRGSAMRATGALMNVSSKAVGTGIRKTGSAIKKTGQAAAKGTKSVANTVARATGTTIRRGVDTVTGKNNENIRQRGYSKIVAGAQKMQGNSMMEGLKGIKTVMVGASIVGAAKVQRGVYRTGAKVAKAFKKRTIQSPPNPNG